MSRSNSRQRLGLILTLVLLLLVTGAVLADTTANFDLSWWTVDGGGGSSSGGAYSLEGTIGQYDAGGASGGAYALNGGYWAFAPAPFTFLPLGVSNICPGFVGPSEKESNGTSTDANGPICLGRQYKGSPNDNSPNEDNDYFYTYLSNGQTYTVDVTGYLAEAQVIIYRETTANLVTFAVNKADGHYVLSIPTGGQGGKYLIRLYAPAGHPTGGTYTLTVK